MASLVTTKTASGISEDADTVTACRVALQLARQALGDAPVAGFVFAPARHELEAVRRAVSSLEPRTQWLLGQSGGGLSQHGFSRDALVIFLVASSRLRVHGARASSIRGDPQAAAATLTASFATQAQKAKEEGLPLSTTIVLSDGLAGVGESLLRELRAKTRTFQQIVGGASCDDRRFKATFVSDAEQVEAEGAVALHVFDRLQWGVGVEHGLSPATPRFIATRARGTTLLELNGRPAFDAYRDFAQKRGVTLDEKNTQRVLIAHELGVYFLNQLTVVRAPIFVGPKGELEMIAAVPEGAEVCILDSSPDAMVSATRQAATEAKRNLGDRRAAGVLVFTCICRRMLLGPRFPEEVDAIRQVFPDTPLGGFVTYGEIARFSGRLDGWHNATTVVLAIPE